MISFKSYYSEKLANMQKIANRDKLSLNEILLKIYNRTPEEYKKWQKKFYEKIKNCHSLWHSECTNKDTECYHCNKFYSQKEWDKLIIYLKHKNEITNGRN